MFFCNFLRCVLFRTGINRSLCFQCVFKSLKWFSSLLIADLCLLCGLFVNLASSRAPRRNLCLPIQTPQRSWAAADVNSPPALPCALLLLSLPPPCPHPISSPILRPPKRILWGQGCWWTRYISKHSPTRSAREIRAVRALHVLASIWNHGLDESCHLWRQFWRSHNHGNGFIQNRIYCPLWRSRALTFSIFLPMKGGRRSCIPPLCSSPPLPFSSHDIISSKIIFNIVPSKVVRRWSRWHKWFKKIWLHFATTISSS